VTFALEGQGAEYAQIVRRARSLQLHHAIRIEGARGTGKSTAAQILAAALLCESPSPDVPCGTCRVCREVVQRSHPDLHLLTPPEDKDEIPVDAVRELQERLGKSAMSGRARVVWIEPADALNEQGQNALLKTAEEPGSDVFLLLCTSRPEGLLPTIASRSLPLRLVPLPESDVAARLTAEGVEPSVAAFAAACATGSLGLARSLAATRLSEDARKLAEWLDHGRVDGRPGLAVRLVRELLDGAQGRLAVDARARELLLLLRGIARPALRTALESTVAGRYLPAPCDDWPARIDVLFEAETDLALRIPAEQVLTATMLRLRRSDESAS
jgi:DNA polymerase III delta' subunit